MNIEKKHFLACKDHSVSKKKFDLLFDASMDMLETFPQPAPEELSMYYNSDDYISHTDSKKTFTDKLYQTVKKHTLKKKLKLINSFQTKGKEILDIGCGTGDFLMICKMNAWKTIGVEPNKNAAALAEKKLSAENTSQIYSEIENIENRKFDVITLWHVLEHIPNLKTYISKITSMLKPNGILVIAVPNYKSYDAGYYKQFWAAYDVPRHLWHFSKKAIEKLFSPNQMQIKKILPMWFDSFYVSLLSEKYKSSSPNFLRAFYIGMLSNIKAMSTGEYSSLIYLLKKS